MGEAGITERLQRIEDAQTGQTVQLVQLIAMAETMADTLAAVVAELGGAPNVNVRGERPPIRYRLHKLENDQAAARAAQAALEAAKAAKSLAWSKRQKVALFGVAVVGAVLGLLSFLGLGG